VEGFLRISWFPALVAFVTISAAFSPAQTRQPQDEEYAPGEGVDHGSQFMSPLVDHLPTRRCAHPKDVLAYVARQKAYARGRARQITGHWRPPETRQGAAGRDHRRS
jgi:hypothetical protein